MGVIWEKGGTEMQQCVVRTYRRGYNPPAENINKKLDDGWLVKFPPVPYTDSDGETTCLEYVLEKSVDEISLYADNKKLED